MQRRERVAQGEQLKVAAAPLPVPQTFDASASSVYTIAAVTRRPGPPGESRGKGFDLHRRAHLQPGKELR
jgi:hypothetical protein